MEHIRQLFNVQASMGGLRGSQALEREEGVGNAYVDDFRPFGHGIRGGKRQDYLHQTGVRDVVVSYIPIVFSLLAKRSDKGGVVLRVGEGDGVDIDESRYGRGSNDPIEIKHTYFPQADHVYTMGVNVGNGGKDPGTYAVFLEVTDEHGWEVVRPIRGPHLSDLHLRKPRWHHDLRTYVESGQA